MYRVLILQNQLPAYRVPFFKALSASNREVTVAHCQSIVEEYSEFHQVRLPKVSVGGLFWQRGVHRLSRDYDIVVGMFNVRWISTILLQLSPFRRPRFVYWGIGLGKSRLANRMKLILARLSEKVIVYSDSGRAALIDAGVVPEHVLVAPNTVHVTEAAMARAEAADRRTSIVTLGRLGSRKQIDVILREFHRQLPRLPADLTFDIVGDGPQQGYLENLRDELGLQSRVRFLGSIEVDEQLAEIFSRALASISYGQAGLSVIHSLAFGVPVLVGKGAISGGESEAIVDGKTGFVCDSPEDVFERVRLL
ncbi:MAG: glycosyltransferase family 4 protein, partial [Bdellovibrionales bacterium]|nr:glycosyltransferase family 4 protein [Bdellovibrionales bacterium]